MEEKEKKEVERLERLIKEDNVEELSNILNSNEKLRNNFNNFRIYPKCKLPLLHFAVHENSQKVLEYLLSQYFVDKTICGDNSEENIYHVVCRIRGANELFSMIERIVPHNLIYTLDRYGVRAVVFYIACLENNIFIVKRVYEILKTLQPDFAIQDDHETISSCALENQDVEVVEYILSLGGIQLNDNTLFQAIRYSKFDIIVYLLNVYLCQSIPSLLHNQFHIFQFSNHHHYNNNHHPGNRNDNNDTDNINEYDNDNYYKDENNDLDNNNNKYYYLKLVDENYRRITALKHYFGNRIWHGVCHNKDMDVVKLIFSLKGIQPEILNEDGNNVFLLACYYNVNIKVIKYIHKLFPSMINSQLNCWNQGILIVCDRRVLLKNAAHLLFSNINFYDVEIDVLNILHYLYLNGIDIHFISTYKNYNQITYDSIYSIKKYLFKNIDIKTINQYLKVISQDFDYLHNEHNDTLYRKPSLWKEIDDNSADEQSKRRNEWKNRFEEHVLRKLSKMIQEYMIDPNQP